MLAFDRRAARVTWTACLVLLALYVLYSVRQTLLVFVLAVFLAYALSPPMRWLHQAAPRRVSQTLAAVLVFVALAVAAALLVASIGPQIVEQAGRLADELPGLLNNPGRLEQFPVPDWLEPVRDRLAGFVQQQLAEGTRFALPIARSAGQVLFGLASHAIYVVVLPVIAFLLIVSGKELRNRFLALTDRGPHGPMWQRLAGDLDRLLGGYIRTLVILTLTTFVAYSAVFWLTDMPYGVLLAASAATVEFIPVIGPLIGVVAVLSVAALSGYGHLFVLVGFFAAWRLFQDYVLSPALMSGGVAISPLMVLFGLLAGEEIAGVAGIFLSVPILAALKIAVARVAGELQRTGSDAARERR